MDIKSLIKTIYEVSERLHPEVPEIAKLCEALITWERDNLRVVTPHYKEPYTKLIKGVEKRWQERLVNENGGARK